MVIILNNLEINWKLRKEKFFIKIKRNEKKGWKIYGIDWEKYRNGRRNNGKNLI